MGAKPSRPVSQLYRMRSDVTRDVMDKNGLSDSERDWVKVKGRRGSVLWVMRKEARPEPELKPQTKTLKINVQRAARRRRHFSFPENTEKIAHRATFSTLDSSKPLLPIGSPRCQIQPKPFISTTHLLKRRADAVTSPKQSIQFEDTSASTAVLCTDFRKKLPGSAFLSKSQYKLIRPKPQPEDLEPVDNYQGVETEPTQSMMSILREAAEIRYEPAVPLSIRRPVVDFRSALSPAVPSAQKGGMTTAGLKAQFDIFSFSSEAEKQLGQYRIKTQAQSQAAKLMLNSPTSGTRTSNRHWTWRAKGGAFPHSSS